MANKHTKSCSTSLVIREMQIRTTVRYCLTPIRVSIVKNQKITGVGENVENSSDIRHLWECKMVQLLWRSLAVPQKINIELSHDPTIPFLGTGIPFQENLKTHSHKKLLAALFIIAK